ncbi:MAG: carbon-nitrogen hydrolase [Candidatus Zixiibacteriota bacterium]
MSTLRIAIDQMAPRLGDVDYNADLHVKAIRWAKREKAGLLVFPELSLTGYLVRGMVGSVSMKPDGPILQNLARAAGRLGVILGFVEQGSDSQYYNSAAFLKDGKVAAVQRKLILPNYGMFEERRFFAAGDRIEPIDTPWGRLGIQICFDALHPAVTYLHQQAGVRILVIISDSPARTIGPEGAMAGREVFRIAQRSHARLHGMLTVYVNRVGTEEGMSFWGGSQILDPMAQELCTLPEYDPARAVCEVDLEVIDRARMSFPQLKEGRSDFILQELWRLRMNADKTFRPPMEFNQ